MEKTWNKVAPALARANCGAEWIIAALMQRETAAWNCTDPVLVQSSTYEITFLNLLALMSATKDTGY